MDKLVYDRGVKTWKKITGSQTRDPQHEELDFYKKMLDIFQIGDYFYVIFNVAEATIDFCDKGIIKVLGYESHRFSIERLLEIVHPEDLPVFLDYEEAVAEFFGKLPPEKVLKYKVRYDYRMRTQQGTYKRLMQQVVTIQCDQSGTVMRTLAVFTDIGFLKKDTAITLSLLGMDGEPSYPDFKSSEGKILLENPLSKREIEVLHLLGRGKSSKEIAEELFLSKHTVDNHRKNMLQKANVQSSTGLLSKALNNTWI